jgi:hypothetical protein
LVTLAVPVTAAAPVAAYSTGFGAESWIFATDPEGEVVVDALGVGATVAADVGAPVGVGDVAGAATGGLLLAMATAPAAPIATMTAAIVTPTSRWARPCRLLRLLLLTGPIVSMVRVHFLGVARE